MRHLSQLSSLIILTIFDYVKSVTSYGDDSWHPRNIAPQGVIPNGTSDTTSTDPMTTITSSSHSKSDRTTGWNVTTPAKPEGSRTIWWIVFLAVFCFNYALVVVPLLIIEQCRHRKRGMKRGVKKRREMMRKRVEIKSLNPQDYAAISMQLRKKQRGGGGKRPTKVQKLKKSGSQESSTSNAKTASADISKEKETNLAGNKATTVAEIPKTKEIGPVKKTTGKIAKSGDLVCKKK